MMNQEIVNALITGIITIISALVGVCVVYINSLKKRIEKGEKEDKINKMKIDNLYTQTENLIDTIQKKEDEILRVKQLLKKINNGREKNNQ